MTETKINYMGPAPEALLPAPKAPAFWRKLPLGFALVVLLPTTIALIYNLLIASPIYVSEAKFVVRSPGQHQPSSFGVALQGVGLSSGANDSFAVHDYITSRDGLKDVRRTQDVAAIIGRPEADFLSRYPSFGAAQTEEGLYKGFRRFVTVGYDSATGISTLRVRAFRPNDAYAINNALLIASEQLINRLNERSAADLVADATRTQNEARQALQSAQAELAAFRNRQGYIDPTLSARESSELIGGLLANIAQLKAERDQLQSEAPASPQLDSLNGRIAAYERQVAAERAKVAGSASSLAPSVGTYELLVLAQEIADRQLVQATAAVVTARDDARRQNLYLERIVSPNVPDEPALPRRWFAVLTVFASALLVYALGWLVLAGVREHRQS